MANPIVSVVVPTRNGHRSLPELLDSLCHQTMPSERFEVLVVDDGSEPPIQVGTSYPFALQVIRQGNKGATAARNTGASNSSGRVLVFVDDDITLCETALAVLGETCLEKPRTIGLGRLELVNPFPGSAFSEIARSVEAGDVAGRKSVVAHYTECATGLLAIAREGFFEIGMFEDPTGGWPNWDDVDFGFRAHAAGFCLARIAGAEGRHWDRSLASLESVASRWNRASRSAVVLFRRHPRLENAIPMFRDMSRIDLRRDPGRLVLRKLLRRMASQAIVVRPAEWLFRALCGARIGGSFKRRIYRYITGAYKYQGYAAGYREMREGA